MLMRVIFGAMLATLAVWPAAAQVAGNGRLTAVTIADDGTTWTFQLLVTGQGVAGDISYDHCQACAESDGGYYCAAQDFSSGKTYSLICSSRTKTVRGDIDTGSDFVRVEGNLKRARIDPGFYPSVEFTLLDDRDFEAYRRFAADKKNAGTDIYAAARLPARTAGIGSGRAGSGAGAAMDGRREDASDPRGESRRQLDRLAEERRKAEATLRELRAERERWAGEKAAVEQARRRMKEERAALESERRRLWAPGYRRGLEAFEKKDYAAALREWRPLADQGHAEAQFRLGRMHEKGWGVAKDHEEALRWYRMAAEQGHEQARKVLTILEIDTKSATPISF